MAPDGWQQIQFGQVADFRNGLNFTANDTGEQIRVVGIPHFWKRNTMAEFDEIAPVRVGRLNPDDLLQSGDLLFVRSNGNKELIGRCMYFPSVNVPVSFSGFTIRGRTDKSRMEPEFAAALMQSKSIKRQMHRAGGGTNISNLSQAILSNLVFALPPLPEQKKIAAILSTWDRAIETAGKLLANAEKQKQSLMGQLLTGQRRLGTKGNQEWQKVSLGCLGATYGGLSGKTATDFGAGLPYITYMMIFGNSSVDLSKVDYVKIDFKEHQNRVRKGDIFFTSSSETPDEVGISSVLLDEPGECYLNSFCFGYRLHSYDELRPKYARHLLRSTDFRRSIRKLAQGATRYNLSKRELMKLVVDLPPVTEQQAITAILDDAEAIADRHKADLVALRSEKNVLMQQLITGERRVHL